MHRAALCIGINYIGSSNALSGCINDARNVSQLLHTHFGYETNEITMMSEEHHLKPTRLNILRTLQTYAIQSQRGLLTQLFVSYSGHGSKVRDTNGDEQDGQDETIVPLDFNSAGMITDDTLCEIFNRFSSRTQIVCLFDSCHSGTILDLQYRYIGGDKHVHENTNTKTKARIICISGCLDHELSYETIERTGACTTTLLRTLEAFDYQITVFKLLGEMNKIIGPTGQHPVICSSEKFDATSIFCMRQTNTPFLIHS